MLETLTEREQAIVRHSIETAFQLLGEECDVRLGVTPEELHSLLSSWPNIDDTQDDSTACLAINNSLNDLLNGLGISEEESLKYLGVPTEELKRIYRKWTSARGWRSTGMR